MKNSNETKGKTFFGTDGIRGLVGEGNITPEFFMRLGYTAGVVLCEKKTRGDNCGSRIIIGKDTRLSGYMFESALQAGLLAAGVDVYLTGPLTTPGVAFLTKMMNFQAGAVISASHNSHHFNGIKFFNSDGTKLSDAIERKIETLLDNHDVVSGQNIAGKSFRIDDSPKKYAEFCVRAFPRGLSLKGWRIVLDCANGATYNVAGKVFEALGAKVILISASPDGMNINDSCGSQYPKTLIETVCRDKADFGIAFDGDGDRVLFVDAEGRTYDGDKLLYIIASYRKSKGDLVGGVVGTLMTNLGMERALKELNIDFCRAGVGDRYVFEKLKERKWKLGGESSGHIICMDKHSTGDGIISALQVLASIADTGKGLNELCANLKEVPQILINIPVDDSYRIESDKKVSEVTDEMAAKFGDEGRILIRSSGTESVVRVMVEGVDRTLIKKVATSLSSLIEERNKAYQV